MSAPPLSLSTEATTPQRYYRPELDGLRFVSFVMVYLFHAIPEFAPDESLGGGRGWREAVVRAGMYGVDVFLVLSAFLITELLAREFQSTGRVNVLAFWVRRALRIWPLFVAYLLVVAFVPRVFGASLMDYGALLTFLLFLGNWTTAVVGLKFPLANHLWTVSLEEQFYLVWPIVLSMLGRARWVLAAVASVLVAWGARALIVQWELPSPWLWVATPARLDTIGLGALLALTLRAGRNRLGAATCLAILAASAVLLIVIARNWPPTASPPLASTSMGLGVAALAATGIVGAVVYSGPSALLTRMLSARPIVTCGKVTYGAYVYHLACIALLTWLDRRAGLKMPPPVSIVVGLGLTVGIALVSYQVLEAPFLRLKERWSVIPSRPV